ncbi:MAG: cation-efflux pump [Thermoplasmata archaeon]|nr:MAG: cation-efflux pump [Thermoplasmata archaeon]
MSKPKSGKSKFIPDYGDISDPNIRAKYGYLEGFVSIIGNSILFVLKLILGLFINSIALIADAFHTLADVGTSGVVIFGFKMAKKPADKKHPFGHGRAEYIATLIIAVLLFLAGLGFIQQSIGRFIEVEDFLNSEYAYIIGIVIIISAIAKELMAQFSTALGKKIKSDILIADAWHHRSDAIASVAVGLSIIGSNYGYPILDPIFGIIVSLIIIYVGIDLIRRTSDTLIGSAPEKGIIERIKNIIEPMEGVEDVHNIHIHDYGTSKIISLHVNMKKKMSFEEAHNIADMIEERIMDKLNYSTIIHLEPKDTPSDENLSKIIIEDILKKQKEIISFHKVQITRRGNKDDIRMHITVDEDMPVGDSHKLCHRLENIIEEKCGNCNLDIHLEPCKKNCVVCRRSCDKAQNYIQ